MIFASELSILLDSSSWLMFMLRRTTSDALEISSAEWLPKVTIVFKSLTSMPAVSDSISGECASCFCVAC